MDVNNSVAIFILNNSYYGLEIKEISEIVLMQPLTEIPNSKPYIKGIVNFRGNVLTLVDISNVFGFSESDVDIIDKKIIVLDNKQIGILVDDVTEIVEYGEENQKDLDLSGISNYIDSLFEYNGNIVSVVKPDSFLSAECDNYLFKV